MFGLTFEKLFVVAVLAAVVIGPSRLPDQARQLAAMVRAARRQLERVRAEARDEMGLTLERDGYSTLDLRQYDPRRIVRDAWQETPAALSPADPDLLRAAAAVRPGQKYLVTGSAAHPQRLLLAGLASDDPRRVASERLPAHSAQDVAPEP